MHKSRIFKYSKIALVLVLLAAGCAASSQEQQWKPDKKKMNFRIATRQLPPEPVYNALRWVRPPSVLPNRKVEAGSTPLIMPIVNFEVADKPLKEVVLILAATAGYRSYCSSQVAERKLTLASLGTMEELAHEIEKNTGINVVIDHRNKEVRFLSKDYVAPKFE